MLHRCKMIALTLMLGGAALAQATWTELTLAPVQVSFPESPRMRISSESTPVGPVTSNTYELKADGYSLTACRTKLPSEALSFRSPEQLYEEASSSLLKEHSGAQKTAYQAISVAGKPGAQLTFKLPSGEEGKARFVLLDDTMVTTQALWKNPGAYTNVERFFNSVAVAP